MLWKIHQQSYINDKVVEIGEQIELTRRGVDRVTKKDILHLPGPHWEPIDDEARALSKQLGHHFTGEVPDMVLSMTADLNKPQGGAVTIDHAALGDTISAGIVSGLAALQAAQGADRAAANDAAIVLRDPDEIAAYAAFKAAQAAGIDPGKVDPAVATVAGDAKAATATATAAK